LTGAKAAGTRGGGRHLARSGADPDRAAGASRAVLHARACRRISTASRSCAVIRSIVARACPFVAILLTGCMVGPDFKHPAPPRVSGYTPEPLSVQTASADVAAGQVQRFALGDDIAQQWWTLFR